MSLGPIIIRFGPRIAPWTIYSETTVISKDIMNAGALSVLIVLLVSSDKAII